MDLAKIPPPGGRSSNVILWSGGGWRRACRAAACGCVVSSPVQGYVVIGLVRLPLCRFVVLNAQTKGDVIQDPPTEGS
eukprot:48793-Pyramimonas_sp.AAC.1